MSALVLTNFPASDQSPLLSLESRMTSWGFQELYEPIGLLDGDLGQFAVFVEDVEHVALGHSFGGKVAWKQTSQLSRSWIP